MPPALARSFVAMTISFPVFLIAREATPDPSGVTRFAGQHCRVAMDGSKCLMLFSGPDQAALYASKRPTLSQAFAASIPTKLDLEFLLADVRQHGATHVSFDSGPPIDLAHLAEQLDALDK